MKQLYTAALEASANSGQLSMLAEFIHYLFSMKIQHTQVCSATAGCITWTDAADSGQGAGADVYGRTAKPRGQRRPGPRGPRPGASHCAE